MRDALAARDKDQSKTTQTLASLQTRNTKLEAELSDLRSTIAGLRDLISKAG